jgi:peptidoglycan/xylan/chitin deacetylase (PgdA/CDA1 family)
MRSVLGVAVCLAILAAGTGPHSGLGAWRSALGARGSALGHKVALTFDDLPVHGALPPGMRRRDIARSILATLRAHRVPAAYGFVNAKGVENEPDHVEVLRLWRAAGHPLGNHTFSHMDLHANTIEAFEQDVVANEATLRPQMGGDDWHWFRYPYLHEGETIEQRRAAALFLAQRGYRVAEVTLNFDDWAFSDPYARCLARDDTAAVTWIKEHYIRRAVRSLSKDLHNTMLTFGRDIDHVMLLHAGAVTAAMLPRLLALLEARGFTFVTLQEAEADVAYAAAVRPLPSGGTWLDHVMATKGITVSAAADDTLSRLEAVCR